MEITETTELMNRVEQALETIRPYLISDGGDVKLLEITDNHTVMLELLGSCGNCPMSTMTLKAGVEEAIKKAVPEIKSVKAVNVA
jgi:Fe-S cluster biogenesis protein NfuA